MLSIPYGKSCLLLVPLSLMLTGCAGTNAGPSLLIQKNVNGFYSVVNSDQVDSPTMFTATMQSGDPVANSGADYYSTLTGTVANTANMDLGGCAGSSIALSGKITNPSGNDVFINMTGSTPSGGTMAFDGSVKAIEGDLGKSLEGTLKIDGGSCPMESINFQAIRQ